MSQNNKDAFIEAGGRAALKIQKLLFLIATMSLCNLPLLLVGVVCLIVPDSINVVDPILNFLNPYDMKLSSTILKFIKHKYTI